MSRKNEINGLLDAIREMKKKYPEEDVIGKIYKEFGTQLEEETVTGKIAAFKGRVIASFGTDNEMAFNDIEDGLVQAMWMDGQAAMKDVLERMPVDKPLCADGVAMENKGLVKKTT